jgi:ABC-type Na+ transport system ATPase subunit NatA
LATLLAPDAGRVEVFGHDVAGEPAVVRELIGLTGQFAAVDELLTGRENLEMFGRLFKLSGGQARRWAGEMDVRARLSACCPVTRAGWPAGSPPLMAPGAWPAAAGCALERAAGAVRPGPG